MQNTQTYLIPNYIAAALSWSAWLVVITKLNPYESTGLALTLFFVSLFFALISTFTIVGFYLRKWLTNNELHFNFINISLRQGILLSFCAIGCLAFLLLGVLTWWDGLLLVAIITLVELYLTAKE